MADAADLKIDIIIPCTIIGLLFLINGVVFAFIMKQRKRQQYAEANSSNGGGVESARTATQAEAAAFEMEQL